MRWLHLLCIEIGTQKDSLCQLLFSSAPSFLAGCAIPIVAKRSVANEIPSDTRTAVRAIYLNTGAEGTCFLKGNAIRRGDILNSYHTIKSHLSFHLQQLAPASFSSLLPTHLSTNHPSLLQICAYSKVLLRVCDKLTWATPWRRIDHLTGTPRIFH